jgi:hypothetical protein
MALANYDDLVKEIVKWSQRDDQYESIPDFILLAENYMYANEVEPLRLLTLEFTSTSATGGQYLALPDDFEYMRSARIVLGSGHGELRYQAPEAMYKNPSTGQPRFFTIIGTELQLDRVPDSEYELEMQYYRKATPLSDENQTNEILDAHPSLYLFGALAQLFALTIDEAQEAKYTAKFFAALKGANKSAKKARYGAAPTLTLDRGMTP